MHTIVIITTTTEKEQWEQLRDRYFNLKKWSILLLKVECKRPGENSNEKMPVRHVDVGVELPNHMAASVIKDMSAKHNCARIITRCGTYLLLLRSPDPVPWTLLRAILLRIGQLAMQCYRSPAPSTCTCSIKCSLIHIHLNQLCYHQHQPPAVYVGTSGCHSSLGGMQNPTDKDIPSVDTRNILWKQIKYLW